MACDMGPNLQPGVLVPRPMSKDRPVTIGARTFQSQKTARAFFHGMLDRYGAGDRVKDGDAVELLALVGGSALHFDVVTTELGPRAFRVTRPDGESVLSIAECVANRRSSVQGQIHAALREAVQADLDAARETHLRRNLDAGGHVACAVTGNRILPADGHMDHRPPMTFDAIVDAFLQGTIPKLPLDESVVGAFRAYHTKAAKLAFVQRHVKWRAR